MCFAQVLKTVVPAQVAPVDPVLATIQAQLAQQKADHEASVAVLKATVDTQQAQLAGQAAAAPALAAAPPPLSPELTALIATFESAPFFRKLAARAELDPAAYTGHSFRRGGATAAFKLRVQDALIQAHGDWASECYKLYCDMNFAPQLIHPLGMTTGAAAATRTFEMRA
ncbi:hypothetical protein CYMTET_52606 [Cymbomonas tetramitiformis]|uniref:Uncharacterized protein n=1 Tax=Cymbomonas tetramitiformis TaxID=36881 RepID=A0AAE0BJU8_9CHLO|nr:hypothetical protein CYMTET_52606 [Cymbomonas tetramitiformis]